jgi:hypothetical protein
MPTPSPLARLCALSLAAAAAARSAPAQADPVDAHDDGYCDHVQGVAASESAILLAPEVFAQFGRIEQATSSAQPGADPGGLRLIAGARYRLTGIYEGRATRARAAADCSRHRALEAIRGATRHRALEARIRVLDAAIPEAEQLLAQVAADLDARRATTQDATATRLRVEELRRLALEARQALAEIPAPRAAREPPGGALAAYQRATAELERQEAKLRRARAIDLSVRAGVDQYLDGADAGDRSPVFAVLSLAVNVGVLAQGSGNARAAAGRARLARAGRGAVSTEAAAALADATAARARDTAALETDLGKQLETLARVTTEDGRRYRQTVWFEWVKARAERAYHEGYLEALREAAR